MSGNEIEQGPEAAVAAFDGAELTVTVYSRAGVAHRTVDLETDSAAADRLRQAGRRQLPVVETNGETWSGYRPDKIRALRGASR